MTTKICTKPFEWLEVFNQPEGELYLCCSGWLPKSIGNIHNHDAKTLWHSAVASDIRQSVIDGSFRYCSAEFCPYLAEPNAPESPIKYVDDIQLAEYQLAVNQPELFMSAPKTMNCAYDRSCNLACPSCRDEVMQASSHERQAYDALIGRVLDVFADDLGTLYVTGSGDPFASRHYWQLLTSDIVSRYPKLSYRLHTNAILFTERRWQKIASLHPKIELIEVSIDGGTASSYEQNRYPAKWAVLLERMAFVARIRRQLPHIVLKINCVVQANNWRDMKALVALAKSWGVDILKFSKINNWGTYSPAEYQRVCVHQTDHPDNAAFMAMLGDPVFSQPMIMLDDFTTNAQPQLIATDCV
ncbi:SPASM domain-containing protein [Marinagarivorans algicola]|uniref:SPASM domain-containing protein n=1 Tax=Marinagarivorans algicola TaxID=1513270 RepID=UPI0006B598A0|nr:SPASM domain-containing protein [Marinagarivorans algicola]